MDDGAPEDEGQFEPASGLDARDTFSRRAMLGATVVTAGLSLSAAAHAQSYSIIEKGETNGSAADPGPRDRPAETLEPSSFTPPPTDHGSVEQFWQSFSLAHRRIQDGGWARQVNVTDFPISKEIAGVNMRLTAGGIRELHWHAANEWALMLQGNARLTAIDYDGGSYVKDVKAGDLWYFPEGIPHSIQGLGPDGCEFLLVFDQGDFSEDNTTLLTDWLIHTPRDVVAKNLQVEVAALKPFSGIPSEGRYIFQAPIPPDLRQDRASVKSGGTSKLVFDFALLDMKPTKTTASGTIRVVDQSKFAVSQKITAAYITIKPGGLRELHWHANADEWQYYISGHARMTLFKNRSDARTMEFLPSDVGYVPVTLPHYIENIGTDDLVYLEMFRSPNYSDISLNEWLAALPPELVTQHLAIRPDVLSKTPRINAGVLPV